MPLIRASRPPLYRPSKCERCFSAAVTAYRHVQDGQFYTLPVVKYCHFRLFSQERTILAACAIISPESFRHSRCALVEFSRCMISSTKTSWYKLIAWLWYAQVKVWFQNRRTKYKRAKADDEQDDSLAQSPASDQLREQTTHDVDDDDDDNDAGKNASAAGVEDSRERGNVVPPSSEQLPRSRSPPSAVYRHNGDDRLPTTGGGHGNDFRSLLLSSRHTVSGCQDSGRKHSSNGASAASRRNKTSHHVNRWRAETNQL